MPVAIALLICCLFWASKRGGVELVLHGIGLFFLTMFVQLFVVLELYGASPDLTYGSDARFYYQASLSVLSGESSFTDFPAPLYVLWQAFVLGTSPSASFVYVLLANACLFVVAYVAQMLWLLKVGSDAEKFALGLSFSSKNKLFAWSWLFWANGIVLWTVARGLKEVVILVVLVLFLALVALTSRAWLTFLLGAVATWVLAYVRPLGFFLPLIALGARYLTRRMNLTLALTLTVTTILVMEVFFDQLDLLVYFREKFGETEAEEFVLGGRILSLPVLGSLVAMIRFIMGPGPFRSLQQVIFGNVFEVSTKTGDVLIFLGSLAWWSVLLFVAVRLALSRRERQVISQALFLTRESFFLGLALVAVYGFIYFGTGDTRHRALLYLLWAPTLVIYLSARRPYAPSLPHHPR